MKTELLYLTLVTALTGLMWVPYILDRIAVWGLNDTVGYPENPKAQSPWARRLMKAQFNAVENLVVFAALVLAAHAIGVSNTVTAGPAVYYFSVGVVHRVCFTLALLSARALRFGGAVF